MKKIVLFVMMTVSVAFAKDAEKKEKNKRDPASPALGVMGSTTKMELLPAGKMKMSIRSWDNDDIRTDVYEGTWQVSAPTKRSDGLMRLSIIYNGKKGQKTLVYRLGFTYEGGRKMWILHNKRNPSSRQIEYQYIKFFNEIIDECEV